MILTDKDNTMVMTHTIYTGFSLYTLHACLAQKLVPSSFISHSQKAKNSASAMAMATATARRWRRRQQGHGDHLE